VERIDALGNGGVTDRLNAKLPTDQPDIILLVLVQAQPDKVCGAPCPAGQGFSPVPAHDILALPGGAKFAAPPNESPASAITWTTASLEARKNSWAHNPFARKAFVARPATFPLTPHLTVFTDSVTRRATPADVLDTLDELAKKCLPPLSVLGAARSPIQSSDWRSTRVGGDAFLHSSVPQGWWNEYAAMAKREHDPGVMMAKYSFIACTWSETMQMLDPVGIDRWPYECRSNTGCATR
jgi:hypothetical protein